MEWSGRSIALVVCLSLGCVACRVPLADVILLPHSLCNLLHALENAPVKSLTWRGKEEMQAVTLAAGMVLDWSWYTDYKDTSEVRRKIMYNCEWYYRKYRSRAYRECLIYWNFHVRDIYLSMFTDANLFLRCIFLRSAIGGLYNCRVMLFLSLIHVTWNKPIKCINSVSVVAVCDHKLISVTVLLLFDSLLLFIASSLNFY